VIELVAHGDVHVLEMDEGENRFNATSVKVLHSLLDDFDRIEGPKALVTTGTGKFFSNGLDLDWLTTAPPDEAPDFLGDLNRLFGRILFNPAPTSAAVNGHAFAGGAMLASAHDHRVMRTDRGFFCIPEVDLGLPLTPGMNAVLQARIPAQPFHEAVVTGRRWAAEELLARNMVEATADGDEVLTSAIEWAAGQAHHAGETLATMKRLLYPAALAILLPDDA